MPKANTTLNLDEAVGAYADAWSAACAAPGQKIKPPSRREVLEAAGYPRASPHVGGSAMPRLELVIPAACVLLAADRPEEAGALLASLTVGVRQDVAGAIDARHGQGRAAACIAALARIGEKYGRRE